MAKHGHQTLRDIEYPKTTVCPDCGWAVTHQNTCKVAQPSPQPRCAPTAHYFPTGSETCLCGQDKWMGEPEQGGNDALLDSQRSAAGSLQHSNSFSDTAADSGKAQATAEVGQPREQGGNDDSGDMGITNISPDGTSTTVNDTYKNRANGAKVAQPSAALSAVEVKKWLLTQEADDFGGIGRCTIEDIAKVILAWDAAHSGSQSTAPPLGYKWQPISEFDAYQTVLDENEKMQEQIVSLTQQLMLSEANHHIEAQNHKTLSRLLEESEERLSRVEEAVRKYGKGHCDWEDVLAKLEAPK